MNFISVTLDTSHVQISPLNIFAYNSRLGIIQCEALRKFGLNPICFPNILFPALLVRARFFVRIAKNVMRHFFFLLAAFAADPDRAAAVRLLDATEVFP